jgi:hypothetical protein
VRVRVKDASERESTAYLCFLHQSLDLVLVESSLLVSDGDAARLLGRLVLGRYVQDTICINVERHLNLWYAAWCWWDARQLELAQ